jgi:hypothetical protein
MGLSVYQSLHVQGKGALRGELAVCLRTARALRKPRRKSTERRGRIPGLVSISERPAEVDRGTERSRLVVDGDHVRMAGLDPVEEALGVGPVGHQLAAKVEVPVDGSVVAGGDRGLLPARLLLDLRADGALGLLVA